MPLVAYVDADILLYQAASKSLTYFDGEEVIDPIHAEAIFDVLLKNWLSELKHDEYRLCFTGGKNFRKELNPDYKSNRKGGDIPPALVELKKSLTKRDNVLRVWGIEADDIIGMAGSESPDNVMVSIDKDFHSVPGTLWNPVSQSLWVTSEDTANLYWMRQTVIGDTTDNYKGVPGIGIKKAHGWLPSEKPLPELWKTVLQLFKQAGLSEDHAVMMARMARILRHGDYDPETGVKLWTPST